MKERLVEIICFFDRHKERNQTRERIIQFLIIIFGSLIPLINLGPWGTGSFVSSVGSSILGALIAVLTSILQYEKYHEKWLSYRIVSSKLKREYYLWKDGSGHYSKENFYPDFGTRSNDFDLDQKPNDDKIDDRKEKDEQKKYEIIYQQRKLALLVKNCEDILFTEASEYVNLFSSSRPTDSQLTRESENQVTGQHKS